MSCPLGAIVGYCRRSSGYRNDCAASGSDCEVLLLDAVSVKTYVYVCGNQPYEVGDQFRKWT